MADPMTIQALMMMMQQQQDQQGGNEYLQAGQMGMQALGGLIDTPQKKHGRWKTGMSKELGDLIRWTLMNREAVSAKDVSGIRSNVRQSMQPVFADMSWGASRGAGLSSPQSHRMYAQQRLPIEAGITADLDKWRTNTNIGYQQNLRGLLAMMTGG